MLDGGVSRIATEIVNGQGFTEVVFRKRGWWKGLFGLVGFLLAWLFGGLFATVLLMAGTSGQPTMLFAWLGAWGLGGLFFLYMMLWSTFGVESLIARADTLTLMRRLLLLKSPLVFPAASIESIEWIADDPGRKVTVNGRRIPQPAIAILAGGMARRCASGIGESEAREAIASVSQRFAVARRRR